MPEIIITVRDKLPVNTGDIHYIVTDNSDYTVRFVFDDDWAEGEKTVYFVRSNGCVYKPQKTTDDMAVIPVQKDAGAMTQLLIGVQQGDIKTSRPCALNVYPSITDIITDESVQPDGTLWEDLMARIKALEEDEGVSQEEVEAAVKHYFEDNPIDPADLGAVSADQGAENADRILGIGEDGKVIPVDKPQGDVKTVAGVKPDASGNVPLTASDVGAATKEQLNTLSGEVAKKQPAGNYATKEEIPAKTSDLNNDSGFITKAVTDLANYYRKNETYTQAEVNALISAIPKFTISVVSALPTTGISATTIYLVGGGSGDDLYTEYIYAGEKWEILGSQRVDLTGYAKETWVSAQISAYMTAGNIAAALGYTPANSADLAEKANRSGWAGNKYLGTDAAGNMVTRDAPAGEGGGSGTPGTSPHIGDNGNWWIGATDTGVKAQGPQGDPGSPGDPGTSPHIGDNGNWWIGATDTGVKAQGPQGEPGSPGDPGTSPHIGDNGNWWIGATDTGVKAQGPQGKPGSPGDPGASPHIGGNGNWWIGATDTGVKAQGPQGDPGSPGDPGTSPHIGDNGNWWIGATDTGVKAQGPQGEPGSPGDPGTSPHIGDNGNWWIGATDTGVKAQGPQGKPGSPGDPGASPHIGGNGNWWIGATDTGVKAQGPAGNDYTLTDTDVANIASQAAAQIDVSGKLDKSGGTMTGKLVAQNNADYADKQVRNIIQVEQGAAMPGGADGDVCIVYQLT